MYLSMYNYFYDNITNKLFLLFSFVINNLHFNISKDELIDKNINCVKSSY